LKQHVVLREGLSNVMAAEFELSPWCEG